MPRYSSVCVEGGWVVGSILDSRVCSCYAVRFSVVEGVYYDHLIRLFCIGMIPLSDALAIASGCIVYRVCARERARCGRDTAVGRVTCRAGVDGAGRVRILVYELRCR